MCAGPSRAWGGTTRSTPRAAKMPRSRITAMRAAARDANPAAVVRAVKRHGLKTSRNASSGDSPRARFRRPKMCTALAVPTTRTNVGRMAVTMLSWKPVRAKVPMRIMMATVTLARATRTGARDPVTR